MKNKKQIQEKILELVKKLEVITIRDVENGLKISYPTAIVNILEMEVDGLLKHRVVMNRGERNYKVWILKKN